MRKGVIVVPPLAGKYLWIWEVDQTQGGDVSAIARLGKQLGLTGFIVKSHDGVDVWPQFAQVCQPLQSYGFAVLAWGYVYGVDPLGEARAAQVSITAGADAYIIDAESGYDGKPDAARTLSLTLREQNPKLTLGFAPFAFPVDHPTFPYATFAEYCDVCLPQVYWGEFALQPTDAVTQAFSQLAPYKIALAPVGQAYGAVTGVEIEQFAATAQSLGAQGISFWDAQSAVSRQLQAIRQIRAFGPPAGAPPTPVTTAPLPPPQTHLPASPAPAPRAVSPTDHSRRAVERPRALQGEYKMPSDVQKNDWFYGAVKDLLGMGVITAYQDGLFKPDEPITRAQAADWLNRLRIYLEAAKDSPPAP